MPRRILLAAAIGMLVTGCNLFTGSDSGEQKVASFSLISPTYPILTLKTWPDTSTVSFRVENTAGESLCGKVPLTVEVTDSGAVVPTYSPSAPDPCTIALRVNWPAIVGLRVRAGALSDSLELRITQTEFFLELRSPAAKVAGTTVEWEAEVRTGDGAVVPNVPVIFSYRHPYSGPAHFDPSAFDTTTMVTDAAGVARHQRTLAASTLYSLSLVNGLLGSTQSSGPGGEMRVQVNSTPLWNGDNESDERPIVPGAAVALGLSVQRCSISETLSSCRLTRAQPVVRLLDRTCPGSSVTDGLVAAAFDAHGNPVLAAPSVLAEGGTLSPLLAQQYVVSSSSFNYTSTRSWHDPSNSVYARLADGVDSARVTVSFPGLPSQTVDVLRDTSPCG